MGLCQSSPSESSAVPEPTPAALAAPVCLLGGPMLSRLEVMQQYTFTETLGSGSYSTVLKATEASTFTQYAAKVIEKDILTKHPSVLVDLKREIELHSPLQHEHCAVLHKVLESEAQITLILECVPGGELFHLIELNQWRAWKPGAGAALFRQVLAALEYVHAQGLCHLDLKPENLLCTVRAAQATGCAPEGNKIKLADFGFAHRTQQDGVGIEPGGILGTPEYNAPEVHEKDWGAIGARSDMWSAGVLLHLLLCGALPLMVRNEEDVRTLKRGNFTTEGDTWQSVPEEAKELMHALCEPDPARRLTASQALAHAWVQAAA
jgi:serine/threonine protein kinase